MPTELSPPIPAIPAGSENGSQPPFPLSEETLDEWRWILRERERGTFDPYQGMHVAVYQQKIVEASYDPILLRKFVALRDGILPERIVITYVERN